MISLGRNILIYISVLFGLSAVGLVLRFLFPEYGFFCFVFLSWAPNLAAIVAILLTCKHRNAFGRLFLRLITIKAPLHAYSLFLIYVSMILLTYLAIFFEGSFSLPALKDIFSRCLSVLPLILLTNTFGEEAGMRGYMLDEFQRNNSFPVSSIVNGLVWSISHLVIWFVPESGLGFIPLPAFVLLTFSLAVSLCNLANVSTGSLFPVVLSRILISSCILVFPLLGDGAGAAVWFFAGMNTLYAALIFYLGWTRPIPPNTVS